MRYVGESMWQRNTIKFISEIKNLKIPRLKLLQRHLNRRYILIVVGMIVGIPISLILIFINPLKGNINASQVSLAGGFISITLALSTLIGAIYTIVEEKQFLISLLGSISLVIVAAILAVFTYTNNLLFYPSSVYLVIGTLLFLNEFRILITDQTLGSSVWEDTTIELSRRQLYPTVISKVGSDGFEGGIKINKGDTILVYCDYINTGRLLVQNFLKTCEQTIYVTTDRPHNMVKIEFGDRYPIFTVDCFTNVFGFGEFAQAGKDELNYTLKQPSIRELHAILRHIRRRMISNIIYQKEWRLLKGSEKKHIEEELSQTGVERQSNVWIVYDSLDLLLSVFKTEPFLSYITHDTICDKLNGKNTILLSKADGLENKVANRIESLCQHIIRLQRVKTGVSISVDHSIDATATKQFSIDL